MARARDRKVSLPLVDDLGAKSSAGKPTMENARRRFGGRAASGAGAGKIVALEIDGADAQGVVLFASDSSNDVVFDGGVVRRVRPSACRVIAGDATGALRDLANAVCVFASLREGDVVSYAPPNEPLARGTLIEKCRYGALVAAADGRILAVGFGKLWPSADGSLS